MANIRFQSVWEDNPVMIEVANVVDRIKTDFLSRAYRLADQSTCQKRSVVCALYDEKGICVGEGFNTCDVSYECKQLNIVQTPEEYRDICKNEHAEVAALRTMDQQGAQAVTAIISGHDFFCVNCFNLLKTRGVVNFLVVQLKGIGKPE